MASLESKISEKNHEIKSLKYRLNNNPSPNPFAKGAWLGDSDLRSVAQPPVEKIETEQMGWSCTCRGNNPKYFPLSKACPSCSSGYKKNGKRFMCFLCKKYFSKKQTATKHTC